MTNQKKQVCMALLGLVLLPILSMTSSVLAQSSEDIKEIQKTLEEIKANQQALQKEFQELKSILVRAARQAVQPQQEAVLRVENEPFKGDKNARFTLVDFSDYQ